MKYGTVFRLLGWWGWLLLFTGPLSLFNSVHSVPFNVTDTSSSSSSSSSLSSPVHGIMVTPTPSTSVTLPNAKEKYLPNEQKEGSEEQRMEFMLLLFKDLNMKVYGSSHSTEPLDDDDDQALDQAYLETQSKVKQFVRSIRLTQLNLHVAIEDIQMGVKTCSVASSELDPYFKLGYYTFLNGLRMYGDAYVTQPRGHLSVTSLVFSLRNTTVWKTGGSSSSWSTSRSYHFLIRGLTSVLEEMIFSASSTWMTKFPSGSSRSLPWIHLRTLATHFFQFYQWMTWPFPPIDKVGYHVFDSYIECLHSFFKYKTTHEVTPFKQRLQTVLEDFKSGSSSTTDPDPYALASKKFSETLTAILAVLDAMETH